MMGMNEYQKRDSILLEHGFSSYKEYLLSDTWKETREITFRKKGRSCYCCTRSATQVHHRTYSRENLFLMDIRELFPICAKCHKKIEFRGEVKRSHKSSKYMLKKRIRIHKKQLKIDAQRLSEGKPKVFY